MPAYGWVCVCCFWVRDYSSWPTRGPLPAACGRQATRLGSAELYNPSTGKFAVTGSLNTARRLHTAHLVSSGQVLIVAGNHFGSLASAELFDPSSGTFRNTASLNTPRQGHASGLLMNGQGLAVGGYESLNKLWLASAELYR